MNQQEEISYNCQIPHKNKIKISCHVETNLVPGFLNVVAVTAHVAHFLAFETSVSGWTEVTIASCRDRCYNAEEVDKVIVRATTNKRWIEKHRE